MAQNAFLQRDIDEEFNVRAAECFSNELVSQIITANDLEKIQQVQLTTESLIEEVAGSLTNTNIQLVTRLAALRGLFRNANTTIGEIRSELDRAYSRIRDLKTQLKVEHVTAAKAEVKQEMGSLSDEES